jgi:hypothetical protein
MLIQCNRTAPQPVEAGGRPVFRCAGPVKATSTGESRTCLLRNVAPLPERYSPGENTRRWQMQKGRPQRASHGRACLMGVPGRLAERRGHQEARMAGRRARSAVSLGHDAGSRVIRLVSACRRFASDLARPDHVITEPISTHRGSGRGRPGRRGLWRRSMCRTGSI